MPANSHAAPARGRIRARTPFNQRGHSICRSTHAEPLEQRTMLAGMAAGTDLAAIVAADSALFFDEHGQIYSADPAPDLPAEGAADSPPQMQAAQYPYSQTFALHSRPGASKVILLDFDGHITPAGTAWNGGNQIVSAPFDLDGDPSGFSTAEHDAIQSIWLRVSEDYWPFDVDVTTEDPGDDGIIRSGFDDQYYGIRCVISPSSAWYEAASGRVVGGVAYVDVFSRAGYTYKPAFVFTNRLSNNPILIAEVAAHEIGHTLGLLHDGALGGTEYYAGHGTGATSWAPIMGTGFGKNVTQWSKGEYYNANNTQDDLLTIVTRNGFGYRPDDHGGTTATATVLVSTGPLSYAGAGVIERNDDVDMFRFTAVSGTATISISPLSPGGNLDVLATLYDSNGTVVAVANPPDVLTANFELTLPGGTWYLAVEGTGTGNPLANPPTGYTKYASLGQYTITVLIAPAVVLPTPDLDNASDSGLSNTDNITSVTTPVFRGGPLAGCAGRTMQLLVNGTVAATTTALADGSWSASATLAQGTHQVAVRMIDGDTILAVSDPLTVVIDVTPPVVSFGTITPAPNAAGWHRSNATIAFTVTDALSGVASANPAASPLTFSAEGAGQRASVTAVDVAGNSATYWSPVVNIDKTPPALAWGTASPPPNAAGWRNANVSLPFTASDNLSGLAAANPPSPLLISAEGNAVTTTITIADIAGNSASFTTPAFKIDKTPPTLAWGTASPPPNAAGWRNASVSLPFTASDNLSGLAAANPPSPLLISAEGNAVTTTITIADIAGNTASFTTPAFKIDKTPPTITARRETPPNANGWNNTDVLCSYTASDALSGLPAGLAAGTFTFTAEGSHQSHTFTVTDLAGNSASVAITGVNIDRTPPVVSFPSTSPTPNANGWNNTDVTVAYTIADALSGLSATTPPAGQVVITGEGMRLSVAVTAEDLAGNALVVPTPPVNIDRTPPLIAAWRDTPPNTRGWNNTPVRICYTATDDISGLPPGAEAGTHVFDAEGAGQSHTFTVTDLAGNVAQAVVAEVNIDLTPPVIAVRRSPAPNARGWNNTSVIASYVASDVLSGLPAGLDSGEHVFQTEGAGQGCMFEVADLAGNAASAVVDDVNIDLTPPAALVKSYATPKQAAKLYRFTVVYDDNMLVEAGTVRSGNVVVVGPRGYKHYAKLVPSAGTSADGRRLMATYEITPPGGSWDAADDGVYSFYVLARQVLDEAANGIRKTLLGTLTVRIGARTAAKKPASPASVPKAVFSTVSLKAPASTPTVQASAPAMNRSQLPLMMAATSASANPAADSASSRERISDQL